MMLSRPSRRPKRRRLWWDEDGAGLYEYALTIFVFFGLLFLIIQLSWWWWTQMITSTAVHDGVRTAGARYGNLPAGYEVSSERLHWALGRSNAEEIRTGTSLWTDPAHRSIQGQVHAAQPFSVPFIGDASGDVRVGSFQRRWRFYGGRPTGWE
jgi:hypothetical protein